MSYVKRIIEDDLLEKLDALGAVLMKGPKGVCPEQATAESRNSPRGAG